MNECDEFTVLFLLTRSQIGFRSEKWIRPEKHMTGGTSAVRVVSK